MKQRVNILLVDDQPARLLSYRAILQGLDQNLVEAASGEAALLRLMEDEFAVILLDVSMPGMDGFETAAMIHQHPRFEKTPIIFVTALNVTDLDRMKGYELGAVDYVYVPVVPEILRSKVSVLVELHLKRRELQALNQSLEQANADLFQANSTLQAEKTRELEALNRTLERANTDLALANYTLQTQIAERERLEQALLEAARRKDEFLAILAHELRNPLAPIRNALAMMRAKPVEDPGLSWSRDVIHRQVEILVRLVDDLLDVSRITLGKIKLQKAPVQVADFVARAVETMRLQIDTRGQRLEVELPLETHRVEGDMTRLAQVVGNLLSNACKYTDQGGTIRLAVEGSRNGSGTEEVLIRVTDTGIGIPNEMLPRLFHLFEQGEGTVDRAQGGLGVGLALVRRLVELHGGSVMAHSEGPGRGSEFVVRLPIWTGSVELEALPSTPTAASGQSERPRFLIVDDNVDSAESMAMLLKMEGYEAATAYDGLEGIEVAERIRPGVIVLDLGMARLDGYGAARKLREQPWAQGVLLIALTGWGQDAVRERSREAGFDAHLVKPVEVTVLLELVNRLSPAARPGCESAASRLRS